MNMKEFFASVAADEDLAKRMAGAADADGAYAVAKEAGLTESFETFVSTMKKLNEAAGEMNAEEVAAITGGSDGGEIALTAVLGTTAVSGCIATAYAV